MERVMWVCGFLSGSMCAERMGCLGKLVIWVAVDARVKCTTYVGHLSVDENCAVRTCVQVFCKLGQLIIIDRLSLIHLRMFTYVKNTTYKFNKL